MISKEALDQIKPGAKVRVHEIIKEGDKTRPSVFTGMVIARKHGSEAGASFTVRAIIADEGVEKVYPINTPLISKVEIVSSPKKVNRAKLYYVRSISRKKIHQKLGISL